MNENAFFIMKYDFFFNSKQDEKMTCDDLAKKCKAGDKKACELYKEKCGKVFIIK